MENREALQTKLAKENIDTGIHYPVPLHLQKAYRDLAYKLGAFPVSEKAAERIVSLPMFPGLSEADQTRVVHSIVQGVRCTGPQNVLVV